MDAHLALATELVELNVLVNDESMAFLTLALWVSQRSGSNGNQHHASILARHAAPVEQSARARANELLDRALGGDASDNWEGSRMSRLLAKIAPI